MDLCQADQPSGNGFHKTGPLRLVECRSGRLPVERVPGHRHPASHEPHGFIRSRSIPERPFDRVSSDSRQRFIRMRVKSTANTRPKSTRVRQAKHT